MTPITIDDRKKELRALLGQMQAHPEWDWSEERRRVAVLNEMIAADEAHREKA